MTVRFDELDKIADRVIEHIDQAEKAMDESLAGLAPGTQEVRGMMVLPYLRQMAALYPPEQWITPDGQMVTVSPFMAALEYIEGGREVLKSAGRALTRLQEVP